MAQVQGTHRSNLTNAECTISLCDNFHYVIPDGTRVMCNGEQITLLDQLQPVGQQPAVPPVAQPVPLPAALPANNVVHAPLGGPAPMPVDNGIWNIRLPNGTMIGTRSNYFVPTMLPHHFDVTVVPNTTIKVSLGQHVYMHRTRMNVTLENDMLCQIF